MRHKKNLMGAVLLFAGTASAPLLLSGCGTSTNMPMSTANAAEREPGMKAKSGASYNEQGELLRPADHREWVFVGAPVTPNDMNDGKAAFPEFHNVYINPASYAAYKQTGKFADGTVILKELVSVGGKQMDSGNGYFQGEFCSSRWSSSATLSQRAKSISTSIRLSCTRNCHGSVLWLEGARTAYRSRNRIRSLSESPTG